jgi:hypothetical protein
MPLAIFSKSVPWSELTCRVKNKAPISEKALTAIKKYTQSCAVTSPPW